LQYDILESINKEGDLMTKEKSCGAVIFRKHQNRLQYVLIQQKYTLHYGFPKGHVESNESEIMTAYREVKEETGLDVEIYNHIKGRTHYSPKPGVIKEVVYFLAQAKTFLLQKQETEIADAMWVDEQQVLDLLSFTTDKKLFKSVRRKVK